MSLKQEWPQLRRVTWKFSGQTQEDIVVGATGAIELFAIPANTLIKSVKAYVKSAVTGATAEVVGDNDSANGYLIDGFAAATGFFPKSYDATTSATEFPGAYQLAGSSDEAKLYTAAKSLLLTLSGTATAGEIDFYIEYMALI